MPNLNRLKSKLNQLANKKQAEVARWFFKTGKGEYGQGDKFLGIKVPVLRQLVKEYKNLSF